MKKDLITVEELSVNEIEELLSISVLVKQNPARYKDTLKGKSLGLIFQKPSCRTRVSFEVGMFQLGGSVIYLGPEEINLGVRESIKDVAATLSRYVNGIVLRTFQHENVLEMARYSSIPVINGLTDFSHPCQALADVFTIRERFKRAKGVTLAYVGDGNNVCNSLMHACVKTGINMRIGSPKGYWPDAQVYKTAKEIADSKGLDMAIFNNSRDAVKGADVIYTDVWASMGQEKEAAQREKLFKEFQINKGLLKFARKGALIMHCLPAHRGKEITDEAMDSPASIVFDQAENRLHIQKAILIKLIR